MMHYFGNKRQGGFHVHSSQIIEGTFYELFGFLVIWPRNKIQGNTSIILNIFFLLFEHLTKNICSCNTTSILSINSCKADG